MRKQTKIAALVSAAALLAIGASMTSFAAKGWNWDGADWEWLDSDGNRVTETWKPSEGQYYWLDENGLMARDRLVEDGENFYYVDENGVRVANQWKSFDNDNDISLANGDEIDVLWYYFGDNGKAVKADTGVTKPKTISWNGTSGKFIFDEDGVMQSGWVQNENNFYYCGDETDGRVVTNNWQYLEPSEVYMSDGMDEYDDQEWFWFDGNGKAVKSGDDGAVKTKYIKGRYYTFDHNGVLKDDWFDSSATPDGVTPLGAEVGYADVDGARIGWVYTTKNDSSGWYYLTKVNGYMTVPFNAENASGAYAAKVINGRTYLFEEGGKMVTGVVKLAPANAEGKLDAAYKNLGYELLATAGNAKGDKYSYFQGAKDMKAGIYYFSDAPAASEGKDGRMLTGKQTVTEDDEKYYYYFRKDGTAYTLEVKDNALYDEEGRKVLAEDGNTLEVIDIEKKFGEKGVNFGGKDINVTKGSVIVTSSGKLKKGTRVSIDGVRYTLDGYFIKEAELIGGDGSKDYLEGITWHKKQ